MPKDKKPHPLQKSAKPKKKAPSTKKTMIVNPTKLVEAAAKKVVKQDLKKMRGSIRKRNAMVEISGKRVSSEILAMLHQLTLPYESNLVRLPTSVDKTAMSKNFVVSNLITSPILSAPANLFPILRLGSPVWTLGSSNVDIINFYDPYVLGVHPVVAKLTGGIPRSYYGATQLTNPSWNPVSRFMSMPQLSTPDPNLPPFVLDFIELVPASTTEDSYGPFLPFFDTSAGRCLWIDAAPEAPADVILNLTLNNNTSIAADRFYFSLYPFQKGEDTVTDMAASYTVAVPLTNPSATATATLVVNYSGYYYVGLRGTLTCSANLTAAFVPTLAVNTRCSVVSKYIINPNIRLTSYSQTEISIPLPRSIQVLGAATLVSNTTAPLYKDGTIYASSSTADATWYEFTSRDTEVMLSTNSSNTYAGPWAKGAYGWIAPSDFKMRNSIEHAANGMYYNRTYIVDATGDEDGRLLGFNQFRISSSVVQGVPASKTMIRYAVAYEFESTSQMFVLGTAQIAPSERDDALFAATKLARFSENDIHDSAFGRAISKAGNWLLGAAKTALPYVSLASNIASIFGNAGMFGLSGVGRAAAIAEPTFQFIGEQLL